jgi:hypothetical protein
VSYSFDRLGQKVLCTSSISLTYIVSSFSFYFWCMIPQVQEDMEGCPASDVNVAYMTLSAFIGLFLFLVYQVCKAAISASHKKKSISKKNKLKDAEFRDLQIELYGEDRLKNSLSSTNHSVSVTQKGAAYVEMDDVQV